MNNKSIFIDWIESIESTVYDAKIFHPDFSLLNQSLLNIGLALFIFVLLLGRRWFPMLSCCRHSLRGFLNSCHYIHGWHSFFIWLAMLIDNRKAHETRIVLALGVNVLLFLLNSRITHGCERILAKRVKEELYRRAMDDAVNLYNVNEAQCREVVSDGKVVRSFLTLISHELNRKAIHSLEERRLSGKLAFDDLLARERLHRDLINAPHIQENLTNWREHPQQQ